MLNGFFLSGVPVSDFCPLGQKKQPTEMTPRTVPQWEKCYTGEKPGLVVPASWAVCRDGKL
jgi:hypothetical protein